MYDLFLQVDELFSEDDHITILLFPILLFSSTGDDEQMKTTITQHEIQRFLQCIAAKQKLLTCS